MNPEKELFNEAMDRPTAEREAFLLQACRGDGPLLERVRGLLRAHEDASRILPEDSQTLHGDSPLVECPGACIGRYKLLQKIGEGGMGVVYMAEQEQPVRRRVALKIIKLGMDTRQVVARFEAERQALALMEHPNIARVLDGGATESGRPYFVMELVQGIPITEFCNHNKLPTRDRLNLFIAVCQAIQHAHQKGVIHRDIKPSNILVTLHDGVPVPKVIDFGVAKATHQKLTEKTLFTQFATLIGTPAYMSPEQAEMSGLDIDTRSDIYALGVLLYELLTGTTPFPEKRLRSLGYGEMQRIIREEEPQRPSTRLSTLGNEQAILMARNCGEPLDTLGRLLRGDLDWIVMKCLEKDRQRRYESAAGLAGDIQRHLGNEPVIARPPSAGYRLQKLVRRHRAAAAAGSVVALTLFAATGISTVAFVREHRARMAALSAEQDRETARRQAELESVRAEGLVGFVDRFLDEILKDLPFEGRTESLRQFLANADLLAGSLTNAPLSEARLRIRIGQVVEEHLRDPAAAAEQFSRAEVRARAHSPAGADLAELSRCLGLSARLEHRRDLAAEEELHKAALSALSKTPPNVGVAARAYEKLAGWHLTRDPARAVSMARECLKICPDDAEHRQTRLRVLEWLFRGLAGQGLMAEAELEARRAVDLIPQFRPGEEFGRKVEILRHYAWVAGATGNVEEFEEAVRNLLQRLHAPDPALEVAVQGALGDIWARRGEWKKAFGYMMPASMRKEVTPQLWATAAWTALLLNDTNAWHSLCLTGLARFGREPVGWVGVRLAGVLCSRPSDVANHPLVEELLDDAARSGDWLAGGVDSVRAWMHYRRGEMKEADQVLSNSLRAASPTPTDDVWTRLLRAAIRARTGRVAEAREDYRLALPHVAAHFQDPRIPYTEPYWDGGCFTELDRREAAAAIESPGPILTP